MVYELLLWIIILEKTDEVVLKYKYIICEPFYLPEEVLRRICRNHRKMALRLIKFIFQKQATQIKKLF